MKVEFDNSKSGSGLTNFCSWNRLERYLVVACGLRPGEIIEQIDVGKDGIQIRIKTVGVQPEIE